MGEVGSQTLGTFVIGENAVDTSVIAHSSVSQSTAGTTGNALQKKLTLGNFSVSEKSIGTPLTKSPSEVTSPTATVNASSTSESITSTSTTSQAESNLYIGERALGDKSLGTPLNSETSSTGGGIPTQSVTTSRTVEPTLEVVITADVTTLATSSALASTASTETVAGETLTVPLSGLTSGTDNATTAGALLSNTAITPRLSPSASKSTDGSITGSTTETTVADSISQAIDGLIASLSTTENVGTGTTDTISNPQRGIASSNALISPTNNSVTAKAFESLLRVGGFVIGSTGFGDSLEAQNSAVGPLIAEGDSGITGVGKPSRSRTTAVLADSVSEGSGGTTTGVQSVSSGGVPVTATSSSVNLQTLAPTTILGSSANTVAVAGEKLKTTFSGTIDAVDTEASSESLITSTVGDSLLSGSISQSSGGAVQSAESTSSVADSISEAIGATITAALTDSVQTTEQTSSVSESIPSLIDSRPFTPDVLTESQSESQSTSSLATTDSLNNRTESVSDSFVTGTNISTLKSLALSESLGGIVQSVNGTGDIGEPITTTSSSANLQTLTSATILGASGNSFAVGGETLLVETSALDTTTDTDTTADSLRSTLIASSLLSESISLSSGGALTSTVANGTLSSVIAESDSISDIPTTETNTSLSNPIANSTSESRIQQADSTTLFSESVSEVVGLGVSSFTASSILASETATSTVSESVLQVVDLSDSLSTVLSESSGGLIQSTDNTGTISNPFTTTASPANLQTLAPATVLAATADTFAVDGETVRLDTGTFSSPVLSESESVSQVTLSSTTDAIGAGTTDTTSPALVKESAGDATVSEPSTETLSIAQVLSESVNSLLSDSISSSVSESELQSSSTTVFQDGSISSSTARVDEISEELGTTLLGEESLGTTGASQQIEATEIDSTGSTESISESIISPGTGTTATSPVFSEATGGLVANGLSSGTLGEPTTSTVVPAVNETFAPATVLAASGNSFAVGGETIKLNMSGVTSPVLSESNSVSERALTSTQINATTEITETKSPALETLFSGATIQSDVFSEITSESQLTNPSGVGLLSDSVATSLGGTRQSSTASGIEDGSFSTTESLSDVQLSTGSASQTSNIAKSISESTIVSSSIASLFSESISEATGGIPTLALSEAGTGIPSTRTETSADNQTLVPGTVLGASADTFAVGGETITVNGSPLVSPVLSETLSDAVETTSGVSPIQSPVLSKSLSESTLTAFSGSVKGGSVLSESIGGLIENIQSDPSISQVDATTVSEALLQEPDTVTKTIDPNTETIGQGFRLLGLGSGVNVGEFEVGGGLTTQKAIGTSTDTDSDAKATPEVQPTNSIGEPLFSDSTSKGIGGIITPSTSETFLADSQSDSTGGVVQTLFGEGGVGIPFTETDSDGDLGTLVSGTVLASTADTEAVAGETVSLLFSPFDAIVDSRATSESLISTVNSAISLSESESFATADSIEALLSSFGLSSTANTTSLSDSITSLSSGLGPEVDPFTETTGIAPPPIIRVGSENVSGFRLGKSNRANQTINSSSVQVDADTASQSESEITASSLETLLSPSVSASSGGTITTVGSTIFLAQVDATAESDGTVATLVPATVLAATADTAASGGETLTLTLKPITVDPDTNSISEVPALTDISTAPQLDFGLAESTSETPPTPIEPTIPTVDAFTQTTALGEKLTSVYNPLTVDPETFAQADVPELTTASLSTILAQVLAESTAEVTPTPLSMIPFEAFRFLPDWAISPGPKVIETTIEETRTFTEMTLEFAADTELLTNNLRPQIRNSGKLEIVSDTDGGFTTVDLASGTNRIELFPPTNHELVRPVDEWFIADFSEEPLGTSGSSFDVELIVVPDKEKAFDNEYGTLDEKIEETRGQNEFLFEFFHGDVSTRRVTSDVEKTREGAIDTAELTMILTAEEARIIEESVSKLNAVKEIDVPDGDGSVRDTNSESRNTVNVTVPDAASDTLQSGEYVVTEWESVWTRGLSQEFTITLKK